MLALRAPITWFLTFAATCLLANVSGQHERSIDYDVRVWTRPPKTTTKTPQVCDRLDHSELSRRLREADFNEFMAVDVHSASRTANEHNQHNAINEEFTVHLKKCRNKQKLWSNTDVNKTKPVV
uniref:Uncharacterized protein n=1 Tax=Plectus sambesii TaxID=2011161 RepID=A0A914XKH0_9BILA